MRSLTAGAILAVSMTTISALAAPPGPELIYYANAYADHYGVPRVLVDAIIEQESGWNSYAISWKGAAGLMQLMPGTARLYGVHNRYSVSENLSGGVRYSGVAGRSNEEQPESGRKSPGKPLLGALGEVRSQGDEMWVAYSVLNTTDHWIEVLPPQIEINSPNHEIAEKKDKKKGRQILAEEVAVTDYRLNATRLAPGERADGAIEFSRPGFKQSKDRLMLALATASEVDNPLLLPVPFVAPAR
jgi:hypothetical protein